MMVQRSGPFVEAACVPRAGKSEPLEIEMMTDLVAQRAQKRSEGRDFLAHCGAHPDPNHHGFRAIVSEEFTRPVFANSQRSGCEHTDAAVRDPVEIRRGIQKLSAGAANIRCACSFHRLLNGFCNLQQAPVLRQVEGLDALAFQKTCAARLSRWRIRQHCTFIY